MMAAMDRKTVDQYLAESEDYPNEAMAIPGEGLPGRREYVDPAQQRQRRVVMSAFIQAGTSRDQIIMHFAKQFRMSEQAILNLRAEVVAIWADEDREAIQTSRGAARRRILGHIHRAAKAGKWSAVAALEKVLSEVEGTQAPEPAKNDASEMTEAEMVLRRLGMRNQDELQVMVERERILIRKAPDGAEVVPRSILPKSTLVHREDE